MGLCEKQIMNQMVPNSSLPMIVLGPGTLQTKFQCSSGQILLTKWLTWSDIHRKSWLKECQLNDKTTATLHYINNIQYRF